MHKKIYLPSVIELKLCADGSIERPIDLNSDFFDFFQVGAEFNKGLQQELGVDNYRQIRYGNLEERLANSNKILLFAIDFLNLKKVVVVENFGYNEVEVIYKENFSDIVYKNRDFRGDVCNRLDLVRCVGKYDYVHKDEPGIVDIGGEVFSINFDWLKDYRICKKIKKITHISNMVEYEENGNYGISKERYFKFVKKYDYKPKSPKFHKLDNDLAYTFGIELEYNDARVKGNKETYNKNKILYAKNDGSLEDGIEFVSHPFDMEWYKANKDKFATFISEIRGRTSDGTGLHIHIGRKQLHKGQIENICHLVNMNKIEWSLLSGRKESRRAEFYSDNYIARGSNNKYSAVNLLPTHTIEIRTFRNSMKIYHTLGRIELTMCLVSYCNTNWKRAGFMEYCREMIKTHNFYYLEQLLNEKIGDRSVDEEEKWNEPRRESRNNGYYRSMFDQLEGGEQEEDNVGREPLVCEDDDTVIATTIPVDEIVGNTYF